MAELRLSPSGLRVRAYPGNVHTIDFTFPASVLDGTTWSVLIGGNPADVVGVVGDVLSVTFTVPAKGGHDLVISQTAPGTNAVIVGKVISTPAAGSGPTSTEVEVLLDDVEVAVSVTLADGSAAGLVQDNLDAHEADTANPHTVTAEQVGLGDVDNTSDADKPVSTDTQAALDLKAPLADLDAIHIPAGLWIPGPAPAAEGSLFSRFPTFAFDPDVLENITTLLPAGSFPSHWSTFAVDVVCAAAGAADSGLGCVWRWGHYSTTDGVSYTASNFGSAQDGTAVLGAQYVRRTATIATGLAVPDVDADYHIRLIRLATDAADTATGDALFVEMTLRRES